MERTHCLSSPLKNILPAVKISGDGISDGFSNPLPMTTTAFLDSHDSDMNPLPLTAATCFDAAPTTLDSIGTLEANLDLCTEVSNSETQSDIDDETDLGAFLLDTFEAMEAQGNYLAQIEIPI